jgi:large subunit ribosomal protein L21
MEQELAVIATGGKQYLVKPGEVVRIEKLSGDGDAPVSFSDVLLVVRGQNVQVGTPTVSGVTVRGSIVKQGRADKVVGVKFKPKKRQKMAFGHRQHFTEVKIDSIGS